MNPKSVLTTATIACSFVAALNMIAGPAAAGPSRRSRPWTNASAWLSRATMTARPAPVRLVPVPRVADYQGNAWKYVREGYMRTDEDPEGHGLARADQVLSC